MQSAVTEGGGKQIFLAIHFALKLGSIYVSRELTTESENITPSPAPPDVIDLEESPKERSPMLERDNGTFTTTPSTPPSQSVQEPYLGWPGVARDPHNLSAFDAAMTITAANDLGKLDLKTFKFQRVLELPQRYDGNHIFELPPVVRNGINKRNDFRREWIDVRIASFGRD
ncbi:hypothetical protein R1sor_014849 [Riccia sorocarpa]|uniref:Uncharacterized protein n=1 Tax=Riccia sorocarpa TaxID=122646 RepID=A0ABD3HDR1_9MARC